MKKFAKILLCLLLTCSFALTGCSLVQKNTARYLNKAVATVGNDITITMQDLLNGYNNYGYQYVQYYGYTQEKAFNTVLDNLIDRKLLLEEAKKHIVIEDNVVYYLTFDDNGNETDRRVIFNKNVWQNDLLEETYNNINEQIATFEKTVRKELNIDEEETEEAKEEEPDFDPYKPYEKTVKYEDGVWSVIYDELEPAEELMGDFIQKETGNKQVSEIAYKRYIKTIIANQKELGNSVNEQTALQAEIDRIYKIVEENKYISVFEEQFEKTQALDSAFNKRVVDYYKNLVLSSNEKYKLLGKEGYAQYVKDMQDDASAVYYHPYGEKFVNVSHVLIKLSDEQLAEIKELDAKLSTGEIGQQQRDEEYQKILEKTVVHARDEKGFETDVTKTVAEVYAEINAELAKYDTVEEKAIAFNKFIYKYGQDEGVINAEKYYVVNLDTEVEDKMVKNFADKSRELYALNNQGGNLSEPVFVESSNYSGYHIIFNAGGVSSDLTIEQVNGLTSDYAGNLYSKKIMLGTEKTYYDLIFDKLTRSDYTKYKNSIVETAKNNIEIVIYSNRIKELY
ncbi:MAG: SurA N-terminal domain-containing protein [Christensenellales bacterium]